jgi:ubiquinone/menaquinone biosynthesis C-methylase UbiE
MNLAIFRALAKEIGQHSKVVMRLAHTIRKRRAIRSLCELDAFLDDFTSRYPSITIDEAGIEELMSVYYAEEMKLPRDPFSAAYKEAQWDFFLKMHAKGRYDIEDEGIDVDFDKDGDNFFPFNTESCNAVGTSLISQGFAIKAMNLKPRSRIIEFGPGWGNQSINLAMMGHDVTVVDSNQKFIDLIKYRSSKHGRSIVGVREDMSVFAKQCEGQYDAALFVASFHHCQDHTSMIADLSRILKPGGQICFADEPIMYSENPFLPYQWGLRLDGLSVLFIRKYGWLEMGFQYSYLSELLLRSGFSTKRFPTYWAGIPNVVVATRSS